MLNRCLSCLAPLNQSTGWLHPTCSRTLFGGRKIEPEIPYLRSQIIEEARQRSARMSLGGAQPKISLALSTGLLEICTNCGTFLLKPSTENHPFISENEHLCMTIAGRLGLPVPPLTLIKLLDGELAFLIKRFDRLNNEKIHIEDFASVLNLPSDSKYSSSYLAVGQAIEKHCRDEGLEKLRFLKTIMLSFLIGNNDLHLKNFSIIDRNGYYELSPLYDLVCSARYYSEHDLALELAPDYLGSLSTLGFYTAKDFIDLGERLGVMKKPLQTLVDQLLGAKQVIMDLIEACFLPDSEKQLVRDIVREQYGKFAQNWG